MTLSAEGTTDPDGDSVAYRWFHYPEPGGYAGQVSIADATRKTASFTAPRVTAPKTIHIVLEVTDDGSPRLASYRRIVFTVFRGQATQPPNSGAAN